MKVMITGGSGFIGSHLANAVAERGHYVCIVDKNTRSSRELGENIRTMPVDITNKYGLSLCFESFKPDVVFHLAANPSVAKSVMFPIADAMDNTIGSMNVFHTAAAFKCLRVVYASSGGCVYGHTEQPSYEGDAVDPISPYGISKLSGETYLKWFCKQWGLQGVCLRYSNVYGPRQKPDGECGVVSIFTDKLLNGLSPQIYGNGESVRDYVFVSDVVDANLKAMHFLQHLEHRGRVLTLNIGTGQGTKVVQLEKAIRKAVGGEKPAAETNEPREGDLEYNVLDIDNAEKVLNWKPEVQLQQGIHITVDWFKRQR